ncbi:MAG: CsgG/HfaB family protein [Thermodesulfobacteriota bacterium]
MKTRSYIMAAAIIMLACASVVQAAEPAPTQDRTLAILPFENNSVTDPATYDPLKSGLSVMLITELANSGVSFKLVERDRIRALIDEMSLGQTGVIDPATAARMGKLLGAQTIGFGAFMVMDKNVRIDMRIIEVETGAMVMAESITGKTGDFFTLERDLAQKIAKSMEAREAVGQASSKSSIEAALLFARGVDALEAGNSDAADAFFKKAIKQDKSYQKQVDRLKNP